MWSKEEGRERMGRRSKGGKNGVAGLEDSE